MTRRLRLNHSLAFKAKVALAALKDDKTMSELARQVRHPSEPDKTVKGSVFGGRQAPGQANLNPPRPIPVAVAVAAAE